MSPQLRTQPGILDGGCNDRLSFLSSLQQKTAQILNPRLPTPISQDLQWINLVEESPFLPHFPCPEQGRVCESLQANQGTDRWQCVLFEIKSFTIDNFSNSKFLEFVGRSSQCRINYRSFPNVLSFWNLAQRQVLGFVHKQRLFVYLLKYYKVQTSFFVFCLISKFEFIFQQVIQLTTRTNEISVETRVSKDDWIFWKTSFVSWAL